jgi:DNA-binding PucR family transcriptional regulator
VDLAQAQAFVHRELGELAADDDTTRRLAATLLIYLDEQSSRARTARRLALHENTVRYRIRQAEQILGRRVQDRTLELRVALALADMGRPAPDGR